MVSSEDSAWDVPPSIFGTRSGGPTVQRLVLGSQLHRLRESHGITAEQAAESIRGSHSKISRMEHGRVGFKERDVADLLTLYGVTDARSGPRCSTWPGRPTPPAGGTPTPTSSPPGPSLMWAWRRRHW